MTPWERLAVSQVDRTGATDGFGSGGLVSHGDEGARGGNEFISMIHGHSAIHPMILLTVHERAVSRAKVSTRTTKVKQLHRASRTRASKDRRISSDVASTVVIAHHIE